MKFLVDANVFSEPTKPQPSPAVVAWLCTNESELAVSPVVLGELEYGILLLPAGRRRTRLQRWFAEGLPAFACWTSMLRPLRPGPSCWRG